MPTLRSVSLGCKVNQYETEYLREGFLLLGYEEAAEGEAADLCIVNTCTVTVEGDLKSRRIIRQLARQNPAAQIIVMGCYATRAAHEVARLPGVTDVVTDKRHLGELLARHGLADVPDGIGRFTGRHRAIVKVQDGCRMGCSYCIIPQVRPVEWSRPLRETIDEIRRLVDRGFREIVLTGIHLGHYRPSSIDAPAEGESLARLVEALAALDGDFRIRLSSIEAAEFSQRLLAAAVAQPRRICPHFHIPMQSGSDRILARMRRQWPSRPFIDRCLELRQAIAKVALTTDVMVGFPGETEQDFEATCQAIEEVGFSKLHVFRFSAREGTEAAGFADTVPPPVKQQRASHLAAIGKRLREAYLKSLLGEKTEVLVEGMIAGRPGVVFGTSERYLPVELPGSQADVGCLVDAWAIDEQRGQLMAALIGPEQQGGTGRV